MALPESLSITNPGAETGDLTGWTTVGPPTAVGTSYGVDPRTGSYQFTGAAAATSEQNQDLDISGSANLTAIDAGAVSFVFAAWQAGWASGLNTDEGRLYIEFYDGTMTIIGARTTGDYLNVQGDYIERNLFGMVPALTRTIRIGVEYNRLYGSSCEVFFDDLTVDLEDPAARVTQEFAEVLTVTPGDARVSQEFVEALVVTPGDARVSQMFVEVIRSVADVPISGAGGSIIMVVSTG